MFYPATPPETTLARSVLFVDAQLLETIPYAKTEYRRYRISSDSLINSEAGTVSVFRTAAAWAKPSLIQKTIYYFHAGDGDDRMVRDLGGPAALESLDKSYPLDSIQIVSAAIGNSFLSSEYENWFVKQVQPWAEFNTRTHSSSRWIGGASMGGFVALSQFLLKLDSYAGVAVNAPAMLTWNFHDSAETLAYSQRTGLPLAIANYLAAFFSGAFKTQLDYDVRDPMRLIANLPESALAGKSIYIDVGSEDNLGLTEVVTQLDHEVTQRETARHSFEIVPGAKHDPAYLSGQLQKTLQFMFESTSSSAAGKRP